jgi:hypothetical protein
MGRRQVAELVSATRKGIVCRPGPGFTRVMGVTKMTVMLGFTSAALNLDRTCSYRAKDRLHEQGEPTDKPKQTRAARRTRIPSWTAAWSPCFCQTDLPQRMA